MKKIISVLLLTSLILSAILCLTGCGEGGKSNNYKTLSKTVSYSYFNTVSQISSYGDTSKAEFEDYVKTVDETLGYYHKLFDIYYEYSGFDNIKTINKNAGQNPVKVDKELVDFLLYCKELYTLTRGKTNVMLGSVLKYGTTREMKRTTIQGILHKATCRVQRRLAKQTDTPQ